MVERDAVGRGRTVMSRVTVLPGHPPATAVAWANTTEVTSRAVPGTPPPLTVHWIEAAMSVEASTVTTSPSQTSMDGPGLTDTVGEACSMTVTSMLSLQVPSTPVTVWLPAPLTASVAWPVPSQSRAAPASASAVRTVGAPSHRVTDGVVDRLGEGNSSMVMVSVWGQPVALAWTRWSPTPAVRVAVPEEAHATLPDGTEAVTVTVSPAHTA